MFRLVYLKEVEKEGVILFTFSNSKNLLLNYHKNYFGSVFPNNDGLLHQSKSHFLRRLKPRLLDFYRIPRVNLSISKKKYLEETKKIKEKKFDYSELTNLKNLIVLYDEEKRK